MAGAVVDSSAVLALMNGERGADAVKSVIADALISAVNYAELLGKLVERGVPLGVAEAAFMAFGTEIVDFDKAAAVTVAGLRSDTRDQGLSLGDRACLALALARGLPAYTADRAWLGVRDVGDVRLIR